MWALGDRERKSSPQRTRVHRPVGDRVETKALAVLAVDPVSERPVEGVAVVGCLREQVVPGGGTGEALRQADGVVNVGKHDPGVVAAAEWFSLDPTGAKAEPVPSAGSVVLLPAPGSQLSEL